ncbi:KUP/HAK/KT family potassium transporter [Sinorhizobium medicae]
MPDTPPAVLPQNIKHNRVLHQHNVTLTFKTARVPRTCPRRIELARFV